MGRSKINFFKFFTHMRRSKTAIDAVEPKDTTTQISSTTEPSDPPRSSTTSSDGASSLSDFSTAVNAPRAEVLSSISDPSTMTYVSTPNNSSTSYYDSSTATISITCPNSLLKFLPQTTRTQDPLNSNSPRADVLSSISDPSTTTNVSIPYNSSTSYYDSSAASISITSPTSLPNSLPQTTRTQDPLNTNSPRADVLSWISSTTTIISIPYNSSTGYYDSSTASISITSPTSLSNLRDCLHESPYIYDFYEISTAAKIFLANKHPCTSAGSWRCTLRGREVVVFQGKLRRSISNSQLGEILPVICKSHHLNVIRLLGVSQSGDHLYLVYEFFNGMTLANCLRDLKNPSHTVLSTWISRMQVATDLARGLDHIHNDTGRNRGFVMKHINSSSIIVHGPLFHDFHAKICHFGTAEFCGKTDEKRGIVEEESTKKLDFRFFNQKLQFESGRGYMAPEFQQTGIATQTSDVYAFGVLVLELLSGEESLKGEFDEDSGHFRRTSVIETAKEAIESVGNGGGGGKEGRLRMWVDRRLEGSFPLKVAERVIRLALECVHVDPDKRPVMRRVALEISKLYIGSSISELGRDPLQSASVQLGLVDGTQQSTQI